MNTHSAEEAGSSPSSSTTTAGLHHPQELDGARRDQAPMVQPLEPTPQATPPDPALTRRKEYLLERMSVVLRYAASTELGSVDDALEDLVSLISRRRYVPGLVAADYDLTRKYWIRGGEK